MTAQEIYSKLYLSGIEILLQDTDYWQWYSSKLYLSGIEMSLLLPLIPDDAGLQIVP